jgi:hypothetical protein
MAILHGYTVSLDDYINAFTADHVLYSPFHQHIVDFCLVEQWIAANDRPSSALKEGDNKK